MQAFIYEMITKMLFFGSIFFGISYISKNYFNRQLRANFKKIAEEFNLSYFLRDRNIFNLIAPPSLSGTKDERAIDLITGSYINPNFTISMTCLNKDLSFIIKKKSWFNGIRQPKSIKTGNEGMDRYFRITGNNPDFIRRIFSKELMGYFIRNHQRINQHIQVVPNSIFTVIDLHQKKSMMDNGALEKKVNFMLILMEKIANQVENVSYPLNQLNAKPTSFLE